jgi:stress response protein YsnF
MAEPVGSPRRAVMAEPRWLPLGEQVEQTEDGWSIRVPLRREFVSVEKQTVVAERVTIRRRAVEHTERLETSLQREKLRLDTSDAHAFQVTRTPPSDESLPTGTLAGTGLDQDPLT